MKGPPLRLLSEAMRHVVKVFEFGFERSGNSNANEVGGDGLLDKSATCAMHTPTICEFTSTNVISVVVWI